MAKTGYVQLRRGLYEHVRDGRLSFFEASLYVAILSDANPASGVCFGSAGLYAALFGLSPKTCRSALEGLEEKGYLKRFAIPGKHGSYPILVNKFLCSDGARRGMYVNSAETTDIAHIVYERGEDEGEDKGEHDGEHTAASIEKREKRTETKTTPSAFVLPEWIDKEAWRGFEEMRKKIRAPLTDRARTGIVKDIEKLCPNGSNAAEILDQSTRCAWRGVYPLKGDAKPNPLAGMNFANGRKQ